MPDPINPSDQPLRFSPKTEHPKKPIQKETAKAMEQLKSIAEPQGSPPPLKGRRNVKHSKEPVPQEVRERFRGYNLYDTSGMKHSQNYKELFDKLGTKTEDEVSEDLYGSFNYEVVNRFQDDAKGTRCILDTHVGKSSGVPNNVHANYVKLSDSTPEVICSQAPLPENEKDFWKQVILNSSLVVDLTNAKDRNVNHVHKYFPDESGGFLKDDVQVEVKSADHQLGEVAYTAQIKGQEAKEIERLHFDGWPDFGAISVEQLDKLIDRIEEKRDKTPDKPIWIHCRAGVGRTGTVTVALTLKQLFREGKLAPQNYLKVIDELILNGRAQRDVYFVQAPEQYQLLLQYAEKLVGLPA